MYDCDRDWEGRWSRLAAQQHLPPFADPPSVGLGAISIRAPPPGRLGSGSASSALLDTIR